MNEKRLTNDEYYTMMLIVAKQRSTCPRRQVSAIIVDKNHIILATGYNGTPRGITNCTEKGCGGKNDIPGNTENCMAVHAEINAILSLQGNYDRSYKMYVSTFPCFNCAKIICNTDIEEIVYLEEYADMRAINIFKLKGIKVTKYGNKIK